MRHTNFSSRDLPFLVALLLAFGLGGAGCGTRRTVEEDDEEAIRSKVRTVAIVRPFSATIVVEREQVEEAFLGRATDRLAASGLQIVGPEVWEEIWRRYASDVGGVYDASSGKADDAKYRTVEDATYRELAEVHSVDAILYLSIRPVDSYGVPVHPRVCGGTAPPYWPGGWFKWGHGAPWVRTACLVGLLEDPTGKQYFARHAPIEGLETYDQQTRAVRPRDAIFQDPLVLDRAVEIVLEPLLTPAPAPEAGPGGPGPSEEASKGEKGENGEKGGTGEKGE